MKKFVTTLTLVFLMGMLGLYGCGNSSKANSEVHVFCSGIAQAHILYIDKIIGISIENVDATTGFFVLEAVYEAEIKLDLYRKQVLVLRETPFKLEDLWSSRAGDVPAAAANDIGLNGFGSCDGPEAERKVRISETGSELRITMTCQYSPRPWVQFYTLNRLSGDFNFYFGMEAETWIEPVANLHGGRCTSAADRKF